MEIIKILLQNEATSDNWKKLFEVIDKIEDIDVLTKIVDNAQKKLDHWPADIKVLPKNWKEKVLKGELCPQATLAQVQRIHSTQRFFDDKINELDPYSPANYEKYQNYSQTFIDDMFNQMLAYENLDTYFEPNVSVFVPNIINY